MRAYSSLYIDEFQDNLGEMMEYLVEQIGVPMQECWDRFLGSRIPREIEIGNPYFLVGQSGTEVGREVLERTGMHRDEWPHYEIVFPGRSFWTGWALAYLQWYTTLSFMKLSQLGFGAVEVARMYNPYHEADISKFVDDAISAIRRRIAENEAPLKIYRKRAGFTQKELAAATGVKLRMIQAYEQKCQDISKAEAGSIIALAQALRCTPQDLVIMI